jgi:hypothetical protein
VSETRNDAGQRGDNAQLDKQRYEYLPRGAAKAEMHRTDSKFWSLDGSLSSTLGAGAGLALVADLRLVTHCAVWRSFCYPSQRGLRKVKNRIK